ncbi:SH3 domain-containing protein [Pelagibacterium lentulum]|uniref:SH3 domain-containing protein n=1 Tax=Pelagibacterium lentulum TaxID=2029865 RepID=UPI001FCE34F5|nr:SH3 domain-containing protein [Pelagibacterium lentulum]
MTAFSRLRAILLCILALAGSFLAIGPVFAQPQSVGASSGLPLPRFVSVRSSPVNVRVGPGTRYEIAWVYVRPGIPVEITQEFDTWRRIRDVDGAEGWLHQNLLVGTRTAFVTPWAEQGQVALRSRPDANAPVRAWLMPGLMVEVRRCTGTMCEVRFNHTGESGRATQYSGFIEQDALWGVYVNEVFD